MFDNNQFVADQIGRKPAFPLYELCTKAPFSETSGATPGRVIIPKEGESLTDADLEGVGATDIVWIPLYDRSGTPDISKLPEKLPHYENNLQVLKRYAPQVKGIIVGNKASEILFNDVNWRNFTSSNLYEFVSGANDLVGNAGGQLYAAPLTWHFLEDCYYRATGKMKDLFVSLNIPSICFCGFTMFQYRPEWNFMEIQSYEKNPYPLMRKYLSGMNSISGVNGLRGIREGIDEMQKFYGFEGGVFSRDYYI